MQKKKIKRQRETMLEGFKGEKIFKEKKVTNSIQMHKLSSEIKRIYDQLKITFKSYNFEHV